MGPFDPADDIRRTHYETERRTPSSAIVAALADAKETDLTGLEPINNAVDADALNTILQSSNDDSYVEVVVESHGFQVGIDSGGTIELRPVDSETGDSESVE